MEPPGRRRLHIRAIHGNVATARDVANRNAGRNERFLERKRTTDHETHEVIAPGCANVGRLIRQLTVHPHPIAPEIGADIKVGRKRRQPRIAGLGNADERTRLRIGDAEPQELIRPVARGEIALHEAGREPRGRAVEAAGPAVKPDVTTGLQGAIARGCGTAG